MEDVIVNVEQQAIENDRRRRQRFEERKKRDDRRRQQRFNRTERPAAAPRAEGTVTEKKEA